MPVAAATRPCGRSASSKPSSAATGTMTWSLPPSTVTGTRTAVRSPLCVSARPETASMSCSTVKTRHLSASTGPSCGADRDSLTQSSVSFTGPYAMRVRLMRIGRIVTAVGQPSPSSSYATGELKAIEKIPEGYRPASYGSILFASNNGGAVSSWYISSDGSITIRGKADKGYYQTCTGSWLTA